MGIFILWVRFYKNLIILYLFKVYCFYTWRNLSVQLYPLCISHWPSLLNGFWNIFLTFSLSTIMFMNADKAFFEKHFTNARMNRLFEEKPLFSILICVIMRHIFPLCYIIIMPYFVIINLKHRQLTVLMDAFANMSPILNQNGLKVFICGVVIHLIIYIFTINSTISMLSKLSLTFFSQFQVIALYIIFFSLNISNNISFILTNYYKFATSMALDQAMVNYRKEIASGKKLDTLKGLIVKLNRLAIVNSQLGNIISLPILFNMLPYITQIIATFSALWLQNENLPNNYYIIQFGIPFAYICYTEQRIQVQLAQLDRLLRTNCRNELVSDAKQCFINKKCNVFVNNANQSRIIVESFTSNQWPSLQCIEMVEVYRSYFKLKIFHLCTINWTFFFYVVLFVVNYAVLIAQTSV